MKFSTPKKPQKTLHTYEYENLYKLVEFYVKDGERIPKKFDTIYLEQHDEICSIKKTVEILEIVKREIKCEKVYITAKCKEVTIL